MIFYCCFFCFFFVDRARIGGVPQAVLLTDGWTRSSLTRDLSQRLPGKTS